jgi:colanic acid/amylovoran biosynthesis glycosyltransferase
LSFRVKVWVITIKFPNVIQPWLANLISQIPKNGGDVKIFSMTYGDKLYSNVVNDYDLLDKVDILHLDGFRSFRKIIKNILIPNTFIKTLQGILKSVKLYRHLSLNNLISALTLAPYFVKSDVNIVHSHSEAAGYKLLPIVRAQEVPLVITFHGLPPIGVKQISKEMRAEYTQAAAIILVNTEFAKKQYVKLGADEKKIQVIPQGTDTWKFKFMPKSCPDNDVINILTVGRYTSDKGQQYALEAIAQLVNDGYKINYSLIGEGGGKGNLLQLARKLDIEKFVNIKSPLVNEELIREFHKAHIFVLPSLRGIKDNDWEETQGVTIQEAQACGTIVIATNVGGVPECVVDGKTALLVNDRSATEIAGKISWIINNPERWSELQLQARKSVEEQYDIDIIGKKIMNLYNNLLTNKQWKTV